MKHLFFNFNRLLLLGLAVMMAGSVWGANPTITLNNIGSGLSTTSGSGTTTVSDYTLNYGGCKKQGDAMLLAKGSSGGTSFISNKTPMPGNIASVTLYTPSGSSSSATYGCVFGTTEYTSKSAASSYSKISASSNKSYTCSVADAKYFCVSIGNNNNGQIVKIVIECSGYTVSYSLDGGTAGTSQPTTGYIGTAFKVSAPSKSNYAFKGWTVTSGLASSTAKYGSTSAPSTSISSSSTLCANGATGDVYFKDLGAAKGAVTLTANWEAAASDKYYVAGNMTDWLTSAVELTGSPLSTTINLAANSSYEFKISKNKTWDVAYGNGGAILTSIVDWVFSTSAGNCRLYTGPAGDYTFTFDPSTGKVSVTYPTVSHPAVGYSYFKQYNTDASIKAYIYTSDGDRISDWEGSPAVTATTTICGDTYFYFALQGCGKNNVIIRYNSAKSETAAMSATSASQKWAESSSSAFSAFATYTISFAAGTGASGSMSAISNIPCGTNREITACGFTAPTGKEFDCWHANVDVTVGGATITAGNDIAGGATIQNIKNDITLTAQWKNLSYTITPTLNNCSVTGTAIPASVVYGGSFSTTISPTDASYQLPNSVTSISGATVTSWDASTGALEIGNVTGNVTFTITATKKTYTVTFYNVGELKKTVSNVEHGTLFSAIKPTVGTGSGQLDIKSCDATSTTFMGWTSDASFQKRSNAPSFITDDTAITGNLELRAVWARAE